MEVNWHLAEKALLGDARVCADRCPDLMSGRLCCLKQNQPLKKPHSITSANVQPSAKGARVDVLEQRSDVGSCGLWAAARGSCQHVGLARPSRHVPGWRGLAAAVIRQKIQGKNCLAWTGRLCLAWSNEHGS